MNRLVRGSVLFAVAVTLGACGGINPDGSDQTDHLVSDPSVVFVSNIDSQAVFVEALNSLGQQLEGDFAVTAGNGLTAFIDPNYQPVTGREGNPTRARIFVKAENASSFVASSITVTANGESLVIPVSITPANLPGTFSTATPNVGDTVTFTAQTPLQFAATSTVTFPGGLAAIVTDVAPDGSSISFLPVPGSTGNPTVTEVGTSYLSGGVTVTATSGLTVQAATNYTGSDSYATAPTIAAPSAVGETASFFDLGSFVGSCGGVPCQVYQFTITDAGDYFFTSHWENTSDLGIFVVASDQTTVLAGFDGHGNGATAQPEEGSVTLAPGTYYLEVESFAVFYPDPEPAWIRIDITREL